MVPPGNFLIESSGTLNSLIPDIPFVFMKLQSNSDGVCVFKQGAEIVFF